MSPEQLSGYNPEDEHHSEQGGESEMNISELEQDEARLKTPTQLEKQLLAAVSHEVNQPLQSITGYPQLFSPDIASPALLQAAQDFSTLAREIGQMHDAATHKEYEYRDSNIAQKQVQETDEKVAILQEVAAPLITQFRNILEIYHQELDAAKEKATEERDKSNIDATEMLLNRVDVLVDLLDSLKEYKLKPYPSQDNIIDLQASAGYTRSGEMIDIEHVS